MCCSRLVTQGASPRPLPCKYLADTAIKTKPIKQDGLASIKLEPSLNRLRPFVFRSDVSEKARLFNEPLADNAVIIQPTPRLG